MFGTILKKLREEKNITQKDLSKYLGVSDRSVGYYETGQRTPPPDIIEKIADFFDVSVDYLLGRTTIRNPYINQNIKSNDKKEQDIVPEEFINADEARAYVNKHQIFGSGGFDADKLDDDEILEFANALLEQMKMVSYKYKKN